MYIHCNYIGGYVSLEIYPSHQNKEILWRYERRNYCDFILDILNENIFSLVNGHFYIFKDCKKEYKNKHEINSYYQNLIDQNRENKEKYKEHSHLVINELEKLNLQKIREMVDHVLLYDPNSELTTLKKYYAYKIAYEFHDIEYSAKNYISSYVKEPFAFCEAFSLESQGKTINELFEDVCDLVKDSDIVGLEYKYEFFSLIDVFWFLFVKILEENHYIKNCANCGRYFLPERIDTQYCNNNSPQTETKTCREFINYSNFLSKSQNDEATKLHKQIYNSKANRVKRCTNPQYNEDFQKFKLESAKWKSDIKAGIKKENEYIQWLIDTKTRKV